jgi:hypothetical protein|tara:strand:+ start:482 stop:700 length:219 start_codon:yes stop_codon:yes gene_type:complete
MASPTHSGSRKSFFIAADDHDEEIMGDAQDTPDPNTSTFVGQNTSKRDLFKKINRMRHRDQRKPCLIYPEDP